MEAASFFANRKFLFIKIISKQKRYSGQREIAPKKIKKICEIASFLAMTTNKL